MHIFRIYSFNVFWGFDVLDEPFKKEDGALNSYIQVFYPLAGSLGSLLGIYCVFVKKIEKLHFLH
jgi:hypothetical protein